MRAPPWGVEPRVKISDAQMQQVLADSSGPNDRLLRLNWLERIERSTGNVPMLPVAYVASLGRSVHLIDVRDEDELSGALGHIPGVVWCAPGELPGLAASLGPAALLVLVSRTGERGGRLALDLEQRGFRYVASMSGGMAAWRRSGYSATREPVYQVAPVEPLHPEERALRASQVEQHLGDPRSIRWVKVAALTLHSRVSCVDGRDDHLLVGTPGGDAGEFSLLLAATERVLDRMLSEEAITQLLQRYADLLGHFYIHSDTHAWNRYIKAIRADERIGPQLAPDLQPHEWRRFNARPPEPLREALLEHLVDPAHFGCGHLRLSLQRAHEYGMRPALGTSILRALHRLRWEGMSEFEVVTLGGDHREGGVLNIRTEGGVWPLAEIPLISPTVQGVQLFVNHPEVAGYLRELGAQFLLQQRDLLPFDRAQAEALRAEIHRLAAAQLGATLGALAAGLPVYDVTFDKKGRVSVVLAGHVPGGA